MNLNDMITEALAQLGRGTDAVTFNAFRAKFTGFANDAQNDLADTLKPYRTDTLSPVNNEADIRSLPRYCVRILKITQHGRPAEFIRGDSSNTILLPCNSPAAITYIYRPKPLSEPGDICELDESVHGLIVDYIVARERMSGDVSTQGGSRMYLAIYENAKAKLKSSIGEAEKHRIINKYQEAAYGTRNL